MDDIANKTDRTWIEVDLAAMRHNLGVAQATGKKVMAIVKGNALGVGAKKIGAELAGAGCDAFGVACLDEAIELRAAVDNPILILSYTPASCVARIAEFRLTQTIVDGAHAKALNAEAQKIGVCIDVYIKLDTGMSRFGIFAQGESACHAAASEACEIFQMKQLRVKGIFTHFSMADMPNRDTYTAWQIENYNAVLEELRMLGVTQQFLRSASNSAAILFHPEAQLDMVRAGAMLFGVSAHKDGWAAGKLEEAIAFKSRVHQVKHVPAGSYVSYGGLYQTRRDTKIAVVPVGFADGYIRNWSGKGMYAVINGAKCPQIGRICMDSCMFDVTETNVERGDVVHLLGKGGISLDDAAELCGTNNMEPIILRGNRVPILYLNETMDDGSLGLESI